jgi:hypothetical protein
MLFQKAKLKKMMRNIDALEKRVVNLEAGTPLEAIKDHRDQEKRKLNALLLDESELKELHGLRAAISMMGLDPNKVAQKASVGREPMEFTYTRILFASLEPNIEKLREHAGNDTNIETWLRNWKHLAKAQSG